MNIINKKKTKNVKYFCFRFEFLSRISFPHFTTLKFRTVCSEGKQAITRILTLRPRLGNLFCVNSKIDLVVLVFRIKPKRAIQ